MRTTRTQPVAAARAELKLVLNGISALRAGSGERLAQDEVKQDTHTVGNEKGHERPQDRAHCTALRVTTDIPKDEQIGASPHTCQETEQWPRPCCQGMPLVNEGNIEIPLRGDECDHR